MTARTARLFVNGGSQAVRLPADFRFPGSEVFISRDARTGDVTLSAQPRVSYADFMRIRDALGPVPEDFMVNREQRSEERDPLAGHDE